MASTNINGTYGYMYLVTIGEQSLSTVECSTIGPKPAAYSAGEPVAEMHYPRTKTHRQVPASMRKALMRGAMASCESTASSAA